jgi:chromosome segregation ATPase
MSDRALGPACEWHEERISRNENSLNEVAVQMAALTEQLKHVAEKVAEVGETLEERISDFRAANDEAHSVLKEDVDALKAKQAEQAESIKVLLAEHAAREKRIDNTKKAGVWVVVAVLGAVATRWGEAIYEFLTKAKA